jgi:hypothetical protein
MNDEHKLWQSSNMQIDAMEAAEGKIPHGHSSEGTSEALPVAQTVMVGFDYSSDFIKEKVNEALEKAAEIIRTMDATGDTALTLARARHEIRLLKIATPQIENALPNEQKILPHIVIQDSNDNGFVFKVVKQIGEDYLSKIVAENAADKLNMLRG